MEDHHQAANVRMTRACKRGRPSQAEPEKSCASKRGRRSKPISLREILQSSPYEAQASTSGTATSYSTPQQGTTQQQLQQAHFAAAYSRHDPRIRRVAERQHNYYTRAQTAHEHAAFVPTDQNMGLSASNQVLYPNISTATYTVPEKLTELASVSGQPSFPYNTTSTVNHVLQTGTSGMPNMHHTSMSREKQTSVTANCSNNAHQIRTPTPKIGSEPMAYLNRCSQIPVTVHSRNTEQMSSPAPAAGPESISYMNRTSRTSANAPIMNKEQMSPRAPASAHESMSYMNRTSRTPVTAHRENAEHMNSPVSAADTMSYKNRASRTTVTAQMSSPAPAHSRNAQQMSSPVAGPESMSYMNRAPLPAHSRNITQINSPTSAIRSESMPYATRSTRVPVTAHSSSYTAPTARPEFMAFMNGPTRTPAPAHYETTQQLRYASLRPRPIRKDHKLCQTEFSMTEGEAKLIKLIKNKKLDVTRIKTEMEDGELNITYYETPIRTDVISCIEPASNNLKKSLLKLFQLREMLSAASNNELSANENDANINNEAAPPLVQFQNVEDPRYEAVSPAEANNINTINAENQFDQPQMPQQQINMPSPGGHQGFPIPTIYNHDFSNFRRFTPHFSGMPQSIRGPNFNIPLSFPPHFNFSNYLAEHFFRNNPPPTNNFNLSGWY